MIADAGQFGAALQTVTELYADFTIVPVGWTSSYDIVTSFPEPGRSRSSSVRHDCPTHVPRRPLGLTRPNHRPGQSCRLAVQGLASGAVPPPIRIEALEWQTLRPAHEAIPPHGAVRTRCHDKRRRQLCRLRRARVSPGVCSQGAPWPRPALEGRCGPGPGDVNAGLGSPSVSWSKQGSYF